MSAMEKARAYLVKVLAGQFALPAGRIEEYFNDEKTFPIIASFLAGEDKTSKLLFFYQTRDTFTDDGELIEAPGTC